MYEDVPHYLNNYDLSEALALLNGYGRDVKLERVDGNHWHCSAIVDGRKVTGYGKEPHQAANMAWANCYTHVTFAELLMGPWAGRRNVTTLKSVKDDAPDRAWRAKALSKGPGVLSRIRIRLALVKERAKASLSAISRRKPKGGTPS